MIRSEARALTLGALGLLAFGLFVALRLRVTSDIVHFLPDGDPGQEAQVAKQLAASELSRTLVLLVDGPSSAAAVQAGRRFEQALRTDPRVAEATAFLQAGPPEGVEEALWTLYQPRRLAFFAPDPDGVLERSSPAAARAAARHLKRELESPLSGLISRVAPEDPTLILPGLLERLQSGSEGGVRLVDGRFVSEDGLAAVLFLTTETSSTDSAAQRPLLEGIYACFDRVAQASDEPIALSVSAASRFAIRAEDAIKADIRRVSIGSTLGLALLLLLLFRSLRLVLLVAPVVSAGFLAGTSACLLLFGAVHGLTLAFGAAMIGVSIDYAVHFHCHQTLAPAPGGPRQTLLRIWPGLALGAATTICGFVALLASGFPGLRELAVFASAGIFAALMATRVFVPGLTRGRLHPAASRWVAARIGAALALGGRARWLLALPLVAVCALAALGLPGLRWNDSIADLNHPDPDLQAEDEAVRARVVRFEQGRLLVAIGDDEEAALRVNDAVARELEAARAEGQLDGFRNLATLLPSAHTQQAVDASVRASADLWPNLHAALVAEGFVADGFEPFHAALAQPPAPALTWTDLQASPLAPLVRPFRVALGQSVGFVSFLQGVRDEPGLAARIDTIAGARLIDIEAALTRAYGAYRQRMAWLSLIGLLGVLALVALRHRALRPTLTACAPALLAALGTLGILSLLGLQLNVLSLVALLMVVSMGVDYGVFLAEAGEDSDALQATHMAVFVAGTSTLLGFGLLAFSDQPPLFSIGLTAGIGVTLCLVLAPTLNALLQPAERRG